jgi:8-oxo-dGTP pyrophosphatase MutT (NUDIX family)
MIKYCLGFARDFDGNVLLIEKNKPNWMAGCLNGIGGKVEDFEKFVSAMVREFEEETGVPTREEDWRLRGVLSHQNYEMRIYRCEKRIPADEPRSMTSERVGWFSMNEISSQRLVPNLAWMVPLVFDDSIPGYFDFETIGR